MRRKDINVFAFRKKSDKGMWYTGIAMMTTLNELTIKNPFISHFWMLYIILSAGATLVELVLFLRITIMFTSFFFSFILSINDFHPKTQNSSLLVHFPYAHQEQRVGWAKARSHGLNLNPPHGDKTSVT